MHVNKPCRQAGGRARRRLAATFAIQPNGALSLPLANNATRLHRTAAQLGLAIATTTTPWELILIVGSSTSIENIFTVVPALDYLRLQLPTPHQNQI